MADSEVKLETVWRMGTALPGVEKSTSWGSPALKIHGQLMVCVPTHKTAEPDSLLVRVDRRDREPLLAESPEIYYAPEHYLGYDAVLVRLRRVNPELLHDLLTMAHNFVTRRYKRGRSRRDSGG